MAGNLVGTGRFELPTCRLGGDRSIHLSYVPDALIVPAFKALLADVAPIMHSVEMDFSDALVRVGDSRSKVGACSSDAKHPSAGSLCGEG